MRILNLAVDFEELDRNRLSKVTAPKSGKRDRLPTAEELAAIAKECRSELYAALVVGLHTGLREQIIWAIKRTWIEVRNDGPWLNLPKSRTRIKQNPVSLPLNRVAFEALTSLGCQDERRGRIFSVWSHPHAISTAWSRATERASVEDLNFHDLRHCSQRPSKISESSCESFNCSLVMLHGKRPLFTCMEESDAIRFCGTLYND